MPTASYDIMQLRTLDGPAALSARESHKEVTESAEFTIPCWATPPSEVPIKGEPEAPKVLFLFA